MVKVHCERPGNMNKITREAQERSREAGFESSVDQTDELMNKNAIGGAEGGRAGPGSRSPSGQTRCVYGAVASGKYINLSGKASKVGLSELKSAREQAGSAASNGGVIDDGGVSRWHISRGNGHGVVADGSPVQRRFMHEPRSGEGLKPHGNRNSSGSTLITADRQASLCYPMDTARDRFRLCREEVTALKQTA